MAKSLLVFCFLIIAVSVVKAQNPYELQLRIKKANLISTSYYLYKPGEFKSDLDNVMANFDAILKLIQKCSFKKEELNTLMST